MSDKETNKKLIKEMTLPEKLKYIWDYHKLPIMGVLCIIAVIILLSAEFIKQEKKSVLSIATLNCAFAGHDVQSLQEEYLTAASYSPKKYCITFYDNLVATQGDAANEEDAVGAFTAYNSLEAMLIKQEPLDIILSNVEDLTITHKGIENKDGSYSEIVFEDYLTDLADVLPEEFLSKHQEEIVYSPNTGKAIGIDMKQSKLATKYGTFQMETILCICQYMEHKENVLAFLEYAFAS